MSAIGRIFIVLNLILSAAFLGWAVQAMGSAENYKGLLADKEQELADTVAAKDNELSAQRVKTTDAEEGQRRFREERDQAVAAKTSLQGQLDDAKAANSKMQGELATISSTLGDYNNTISQLSSAKDAAVQRAHDAENERDDANANAQAAEMARRDAEEAKGNAETRIASLEAETSDLTGQISQLEATLATIVAQTGINVDDVQVVPQLEASVLEARADLSPGLVMLNKGSNDGVKRGWTFHIYRGGTYKGQVRVEDVDDMFCSAVVIGSPKSAIAQGDMATTIL